MPQRAVAVDDIGVHPRRQADAELEPVVERDRRRARVRARGRRAHEAGEHDDDSAEGAHNLLLLDGTELAGDERRRRGARNDRRAAGSGGGAPSRRSSARRCAGAVPGGAAAVRQRPVRRGGRTRGAARRGDRRRAGRAVAPASIAANAGRPASSERSRDSCASRTTSAVVEMRRAVSPIRPRGCAATRPDDDERGQCGERERGLVPPEVAVHPVVRTEAFRRRSACAPSAQTAADTSRKGTRKAYPRAGDPERRGDPQRLAAAGRRRPARLRPRAAAVRRSPASRRDALVVVVHGGSWKATYNLTHLAHLCIALRRLGRSRRSTSSTGASAIPAAGGPARSRTCCSRSSTRGRSRGGSSSSAIRRAGIWRCSPPRGPACRSWRSPPCVTRRRGRTTPSRAFFGGTSPAPEASPLAQLPLGVQQILVHGTADDVVPFEQSARYAGAPARRGRAGPARRSRALRADRPALARVDDRRATRCSACSRRTNMSGARVPRTGRLVDVPGARHCTRDLTFRPQAEAHCATLLVVGRDAFGDVAGGWRGARH